MTWSMRLLVTMGLLIQVGALGIALVGARRGLLGPEKLFVFFLICFVYALGFCLMNGILASEFVRKTQLEADQLAARQVQQTLHPQILEQLPGYEMEMSYKPLRGVGGDYFDVIDLPDGRRLIAIADVSGKGMPAAMLAANIQALVRSITSNGADLVSLAIQINKHLCRYTPSDRFATAIFAALSPETGEVTYVNAGHNPPILSEAGSATFLESTGLPLGLLSEAAFDFRTVTMPAGAKLLIFTDGLPDGIGGQIPEQRMCDVLRGDGKDTMQAIEKLIDSKFNEDDVTILFLRRLVGATAALLRTPTGHYSNER
jgi:sigma-B regulation protein RsbU (phosphoserine phosphatase)